MMQSRFFVSALACLGLVLPSAMVLAGPAEPSFSAEMVMTNLKNPQQSMTARIMVSDGKRREEMPIPDQRAYQEVGRQIKSAPGCWLK